ncbi:hypothetical protein Vadar_027271 [Vaccinium darrowii]|uniref:Uncharacterized protein n=1 Tax=Vaccinium darrowii TaxID=229202 RepID=A0ACB7XCT5_9ERIC|nr:hypothetical protein Vadar_027271 [Vaccinium darrowii]
MSRCFPFPPPGYEKKTTLDDTDLLTKEKHKEKRHKKDKEKREGKERKKDRERSEGQAKEKKERKEKHKDRNDKDRDKKSNLVETDIVRPLEGQNGEKHGSKCPESGGTVDSKFLLELGKRIKDGGGARENQMFQSITVTYQKSGELPCRVVEINIAKSTEAKETYGNKKDSDRNINGQRKQVEARGMENGCLRGFNVENGVVQGFSRTDQKRVGGVAGPVDKDVKTQMEGKKKHKHKDGERQKSRDKPDYEDRTKEKEKEAKVKEKEPNKKQPTFQESNKHGTDSPDLMPSHLLKDGNKNSTYHINLGKRKEPEMNGFSHDDGIRPNKLPRLISSSHQFVENGRKLELCQSALQLACERQAASNDQKVEGKISSSPQILQNGRKLEPKPTAIGNRTNKDAMAHGLIEAQKPNASFSKPSSTARAKEKVKDSVKLPHPDSKYLSEILNVPKVAEWSDFDNQEWLFSSNNLHAEKPNAPPIGVDGTPQVWAQALRIESMDVTALPYVIPF